MMAGNQPRPSPLPAALADDLASILADALVADLKAYPTLSDIPPLPGESVGASGGNHRRAGATVRERRP
jgi:hypothetical protein